MPGARFAWASLAVVLLLGCDVPGGRVRAEDHDEFWLWAGVAPQPVLDKARTVYLLDSEVRARAPQFADLRPAIPRIEHAQLWLVVRAETLDWPEGTLDRLIRRLDAWEAAGNDLAGLQIDFDARTRHLENYAQFLRGLRAGLPARYRLSVTGLLDWSANGDPQALSQLRGVVDEVVLQTYQGRQTIPGYEKYFVRMRGLEMTFKVGLVQHGEWTPPDGLEYHPFFKGYVVFLLNPRSE